MEKASPAARIEFSSSYECARFATIECLEKRPSIGTGNRGGVADFRPIPEASDEFERSSGSDSDCGGLIQLLHNRQPRRSCHRRLTGIERAKLCCAKLQSPQPSHPIRIKGGIIPEHGDRSILRLRDNDPIKRIAVVMRESRHDFQMRGQDG